MPVVTDKKLKDLLAEDRVTALTLDTNVFDGQQLNFKSPALRAVASLKDRPFRLLLSGTVVRETRSHVAKSTQDALKAVRETVGKALFAFDTLKPTRDDLLDQITSGRSSVDAAGLRVSEFLRDSACEVLNDAALADIASIYDAYFDRLPPFSHGKKAEFPDALALHALEHAAKACGTGLLVVSKDSDWKAFCEKSQSLYLVSEVTKALSLINDAPIGLRKAVLAWFGDDQKGQTDVRMAISSHLESLDVDSTANASSGEVETFAWGPEVQSVEWPYETEIDLIETERTADGGFKAVVSLPVVFKLRFSVELNFSVWDSVDKESVGMGSRTVEVDREEHGRATVTLHVRSVGERDEQVDFVSFEMDVNVLDIDLGEVDIFEAEDYGE